MPLRAVDSFGEFVVTTMPSAAGTVQEAGVPGGPPSISTTHMRQAPNAFMPG